MLPSLNMPFIPRTAVNLGLDLRGGASLVLEVDFNQYYKERMYSISESIRRALNDAGIRVRHVSFGINANTYRMTIELRKNTKEKYGDTHLGHQDVIEDNHWHSKKEHATDHTENKVGRAVQDDKVQKVIANVIGNSDFTMSRDTFDENFVIIDMKESSIRAAQDSIISQSIEIVRRRIDESGTKEIDLQRQGEQQILLQVPGTYDTSEIKKILGKTAKLTLHHVSPSYYGPSDTLPLGFKLLQVEVPQSERDIGESDAIDEDERDTGSPFGDERRFLAISLKPAMSGDMIMDASASVHEGQNVVNVRFTNTGTKAFAEITSKNVGKMLAIVLDDKIISAPHISEPILSGMCMISGSFTSDSADELATLLRAGALPAPLKIVEERTVGPTLGKDSIQAGTDAVIIASLSVAVFMIIFYGLWGVFADLALVFNILMILAVLGVIDATLTLPGLAAIALTLGMAVDANVLICERIREEHQRGITVLSAIEHGYKRSFTTILDSNLTTIAAAGVLYIFGTGPIRGFAVSLVVGILCSMFTSIYVTKLFVLFWHRCFGFKKLWL